MSNGFAPCRIDWRPSRLLCGSIILLASLASLSCFRSALAPAAAWALAIGSGAYGLYLASREWRRPVIDIVIAGDGAVRVDEQRVQGFRVAWRGPLVVASWRDGPAGGGKTRRRLWLPDTLDDEARRELRLAMIRTAPARIRETVAP